MSDVLCIRFRDSELTPLSTLSWVVLTPQAEVQSSGHCLLQDLDREIPAKSGPRQTTIIVPTEAILLTKILVPEVQRRHLRQTLPFMVEEQIIDPIESMHLVTPALAVGEQQLVGCIRRELLSDWLDLLNAVEIQPDRLVADALCAPSQNGDWQLLFDRQRVLLRQPDGSEGMSLMHDSLRPVLEILLNQSIDSESEATDSIVDDDVVDYVEVMQHRPSSIAMYLCPEESLADLAKRRAELLESDDKESDDESKEAGSPDNTEVEIPAEQDSVLVDDHELQESSEAERKSLAEYIRSENIDAQLINLSETATEALAITAVREQDKLLNFLQGDFTPLNANVATRSFIKKVGVACAACLGLFLIVTLAGGFYLNIRADGYHDKSVAIYKELFPKQRRIRDPVRQMKSQLRGGSVATTVSDFLPLLDVASKSLQQIEQQNDSNTTIRQLRYDAQRGSINMELQTSNIDELESYRDLLSGEGLSVDILSANQDDNVVNGRLQIGRS